MLRFTIALIGNIALSALTLTSAAAQAINPYCGDHTEIISHLDSLYAEARAGFGLLDDGRMVEIFTSKRGTWTLLVTVPGGATCLVATGEAWQSPAAVAASGPMA